MGKDAVRSTANQNQNEKTAKKRGGAANRAMQKHHNPKKITVTENTNLLGSGAWKPRMETSTHQERIFANLPRKSDTMQSSHVQSANPLTVTQANEAYRRLELSPGSFDAQVAAAYTKAWVNAEVVKENGKAVRSRTALAKQAILDQLPPEQARSRQVKDLLNKVIDMFVQVGREMFEQPK